VALRKSMGLKVLGAALITLSVLGFMTVADDWRHTGELLGVGSVLIAGVVLLLIALARGKVRR
jgi:hypothetical protein